MGYNVYGNYKDERTEPRDWKESKHTLEYDKEIKKYITFNGSEIRKFDDIEDALDQLEARWMGEITNRKEVVDSFNEHIKGDQDE